MQKPDLAIKVSSHRLPNNTSIRLAFHSKLSLWKPSGPAGCCLQWRLPSCIPSRKISIVGDGFSSDLLAPGSELRTVFPAHMASRQRTRTPQVPASIHLFFHVIHFSIASLSAMRCLSLCSASAAFCRSVSSLP